MCDTCQDRGTCPFREAGAENCLYDFLITMIKSKEMRAEN